MLYFRNYSIKMFIALSLVAIPTLSFGMEPDSQASDVGSYSRGIVGTAKNTAGFVLQKAWDHPYVVIGTGCVVTGLVLSKYLFATQADYNAGMQHLTEYRKGQRARVKRVQDCNHEDTQQQLKALEGRQAAVVLVLDATQGNLDYVRVSNDSLLAQLERYGLQSTAFYRGLQNSLQQTGSVAKDQADGLQLMQANATGIAGSLDNTQQKAVVLLRTVGSSKSKLARTIALLQQSGEDADVIERRVRELIANGAQVQLLEDEDIDQ